MPETKIITGDALTTLRQMKSDCVHCVVTSPPYFGLRDYGNGAQIGLEPSPTEYVAKLTEIFREVRRVLRPDGTCWLNLGDSYAASTKGSGGTAKGTIAGGKGQSTNAGSFYEPWKMDLQAAGLKAKDLIGIPWRVAFALQADGWYLRQDIIWHKPNPMPESVRDRCTKAHEYLFLLTKSDKYFFDADAIKESAVGGTPGNKTHKGKTAYESGDKFHRTKVGLTEMGPVEFRNKRSVWTIAPKPYKEAHFATFPPALVEPCIKAGTSEHGCCPQCQTPWVRVAERKAMVIDRSDRTHEKGRTRSSGTMVEPATSDTLGFYPQCACIGAPALPKYPDEPEAGHDDQIILWRRECENVRAERERLVGVAANYPVAPCIVMDIFAGAGTTGLVAKQLNRHAILIELNPDYVKLIEKRLT